MTLKSFSSIHIPFLNPCSSYSFILSEARNTPMEASFSNEDENIDNLAPMIFVDIWHSIRKMNTYINKVFFFINFIID